MVMMLMPMQIAMVMLLMSMVMVVIVLMLMATVEQSFSGQGELGESWPFIQEHFLDLEFLQAHKNSICSIFSLWQVLCPVSVTKKKFTGGRLVLTGEQGSRKIWKVF